MVLEDNDNLNGIHHVLQMLDCKLFTGVNNLTGWLTTMCSVLKSEAPLIGIITAPCEQKELSNTLKVCFQIMELYSAECVR